MENDFISLPNIIPQQYTLKVSRICQYKQLNGHYLHGRLTSRRVGCTFLVILMLLDSFLL